jgi:AcrR family transcriptional regulator
VTFEAIAGEAGVNKTTLYRNWPTKAALILAAAKDRSETLIQTESTGHPEEDLVRFLTSVADNITSPLGHALVVATLNDADDPDVTRARDDFWHERFQAAEELVRSASESTGGVVVAEGLIERLIGPLFLRVFITGAPVDDTFIRNTVRASLCLSGRDTPAGATATSRFRPSPR